MLHAGVVNHNVSQASEAFRAHPHAPCPLSEAWRTGSISLDRSPLKPWTKDLNSSPGVLHIRVSDTTLVTRKDTQEANPLLHLVHWIFRATRFRFAEDVVDDLLQQPS